MKTTDDPATDALIAELTEAAGELGLDVSSRTARPNTEVITSSWDCPKFLPAESLRLSTAMAGSYPCEGVVWPTRALRSKCRCHKKKTLRAEFKCRILHSRCQSQKESDYYPLFASAQARLTRALAGPTVTPGVGRVGENDRGAETGNW